MRALVLTATIHLMACGASSQQVRESSCAVYEKAVQACRALPEQCPWRSTGSEAVD